MTKEKQHGNGFMSALKSVLSSPYFSIFIAACSLASWFLGLDVEFIAVLSITTALMLILLDDGTPLFSQFIFVNTVLSYENSPLSSSSDYYYQAQNMIAIVAVVVIVVIAAIYRFAMTVKAGRFRFTPVFISVLALSAVYLLNGVFSDQYKLSDFVFGLLLVICTLPAFALIVFNIKPNDKTFRHIGITFVVFSLTLIIELIATYARIEGDIFEIEFNTLRGTYLWFGWGRWNTMGMLLVVCIPPVLYLAAKSRFGAVFLAYAAVLAVAVMFALSRQAYMGMAIVLPIGYIAALVKTKHKKSCFAVTAVIAVVIILVIFAARDEFSEKLKEFLMKGMFTSEGFSGNGRSEFYAPALENLKNYPIFGAGFYADNIQAIYGTKYSYAALCHNTFIQMASACGWVGLIVYIVHRLITAVCAFRDRSFGKFMIALTLTAYLVMCLVDNHLFNLTSTFVYCSLLPFVVVTPPKKAKKKAEKKPEEPVGYKAGEDEFLDGLTTEERIEFFRRFIGGKDGSVREYAIGGDNRGFFKDCFIYLGELDGVVSYPLMQKIYAYAKKYDVR